MNRILPILLLALCSLSANAEDIKLPSGALTTDSLPGEWTLDSQFHQSLPVADEWWKMFDDPILDRLIELGQANNYDIKAAYHRIESAKQLMHQAQSAYFPTLGFTAGWNKGRQSGAITDPAGKAVTTDYFSLGLNASWEIDLFGRVKSQTDYAKTSVLQQQADLTAAMVTMAANIATAYFNLRMYQAEYEVALNHIERQEKIVAITEARHEAGLASMLDVRQARVVLYSTQATVPGLEALIQTSINSISVLVGGFPSEISEQLVQRMPMPNCYATVDVGVPAELVRRRPDIVAAEYELAGYASQIGIAKKDFLPQLAITGSIGTSAHKIGDLFSHESLTWSVAPQLSWTVFDGLARKYKVAQARENMLAAIDTYNMTVLNAYTEVESAMTTYSNTLQTISMLNNVIEESSKALDLSLDMYKEGLTAFTNVVDAQMSYLTYQNDVITSRGKALISLVNLYQSLGGGWTIVSNK